MCRQGVATLVQLLLSLPAAERKVRGAPAACAGAIGSVTASASAAAMKIVRAIGYPRWDGGRADCTWGQVYLRWAGLVAGPMRRLAPVARSGGEMACCFCCGCVRQELAPYVVSRQCSIRSLWGAKRH